MISMIFKKLRGNEGDEDFILDQKLKSEVKKQ